MIGSRLVYASPAFETMTGRSCQEACEKPSPWRDLAIAEHRERVVADYLRLLAGEETRSEYQIRHSNGAGEVTVSLPTTTLAFVKGAS